MIAGISLKYLKNLLVFKLYPLSRTNFKIEYRDFGHFRKLRPHIVDKPKIEVRHLVVSGS